MTPARVTEVRVAMSRCLEPAPGYVVKLCNTWYVTCRESGGLLRGPSFKTKKAAVAYADVNASAVYKRLAEELVGTAS